MKSRARHLLDKSIDALLAAVEVYNKPTFTYREDAFSILAVNAWELLLKARILQIDRNRLAAILEYERRERADGTLSTKQYRKKNRAGNDLTLGLFKAHDRLINEYKDSIDPAVRKNLEALVEIRDNAIHFFNNDFTVTSAIHEIGTASIKNYLSAVRQWFGVDLAQYRIFIMPLAFLGTPPIAEGLSAQQEHFLRYLETVRKDAPEDVDRDFNVALTIELRVKRTKAADASPIVMSSSADAVKITLEEEDIRERYPWNYDILTARLRKRYADFKANQRYHNIRKPLEQDTAYCRERLLDPGNPKSSKMKFYNPNILKAFDQEYTRATLPETT